MPTITIGYGKANLAHTLATYATMKVEKPFRRSSAATTGVKQGANQTTRVGTQDMNGVLISANVQHEVGTVILVQVSWFRTNVGGHLPVKDGGLFMRLRHGAPLWNINAYVPLGAENVCGDSFLTFSGYADIMNADELKLLGLEVPRQWTGRFMDPQELEGCFRLTQVTPESIPRPSLTAIATPTGMELREIAQLPPRRMILRRRE